MPFLLDTCTFIWMAIDRSQLSSPAKAKMFLPAADLRLAAVSALEIERLVAARRIQITQDTDTWLAAMVSQYRILEIPMDLRIASLSARLPPIHKDPCDRIIIATAMIHRLPIVTPDTTIPRYPDIKTIWY